jgi:uncharacterized membrane protein
MTDRSNNPNKFLSLSEQQQIMDAIGEAEKNTSGEIRLHLQRSAGKDVFETAKNIFEKIGMTATKDRNGVLFFLALKEKKFAILGDKGINEKVPEGFWDQIKDNIADKFAQGKFAEGLAEGIRACGEQLSTYFLYQSDDVNELPDEISIG